MAKEDKKRAAEIEGKDQKPAETKTELESLVDDAAVKPDEVLEKETAKKASTSGGAAAAPAAKTAPAKEDPSVAQPLPPTGPTIFETATGSQKFGGSDSSVANRAGALSASNSVISFKKAINNGRVLDSVHIPEDAPTHVLPEVYKLGNLIDTERIHYEQNESINDLDNNIYQQVDDYGEDLETTIVMNIDGLIDTTARTEVGASDVKVGYVEGAVDLGLLAAIRPGVATINPNEWGKALNEPDGGYHGRNEDAHVLFEVNNFGNTVSTFSRFNDNQVLQTAHFSFYKTGAFADVNMNDKIDIA